jgi:hypothetical protein
MCEAYLGIDPDLDLLKYFFRVRRLQDHEAELMTSEGAVIHVKSEHGVDPYLEIPMAKSMKGWWKKWFYPKNDDSTPAFLGRGTAGKDLGKIQPMCEYLQQLRQEGLIRIHFLQTFFTCRIQPLWKWRTKMWVYLGSSCLDCPSHEELSAVEVHNLLDSTTTLSTGTSPDSLRRGVASIRVSTQELISMASVILSFHYTHDLAQGLTCGGGESRGADLPMDASGREASHASNGAARACEERERDRRAANRAVRKRGMEVPTRSVSSGKGEIKGGVALPPMSPPCAAFSLPQGRTPFITGNVEMFVGYNRQT